MRYDPETSVLDEIKDAALIRNLRSYAEAAGLEGNPQFIWQSVKKCPEISKNDKECLRHIKSLITDAGKYGYLYTGEKQPIIKFMAMTGLLVRNYIDATYITMTELIGTLMHGDEPSSRVMFIPDFFITSFSTDNTVQVRGSLDKKLKAKTRLDIPDWKREMVYSFLLRRMSQGKITIVYVSDMDIFKNSYGFDIHDFVENHYAVVA